MPGEVIDIYFLTFRFEHVMDGALSLIGPAKLGEPGGDDVVGIEVSD